LKVYVVKYFLFGDLAKSVVLAKDIKNAMDYIICDDVRISDVVSCVEVYEEGTVLTWHQP
jgi:hypothetical protein